MRIFAVLIMFTMFTACQPDESEMETARKYTTRLTKELMCKPHGKAEALREIAETATLAPSANVAEVAYETASGIEREGCSKTIKMNAERWRVRN